MGSFSNFLSIHYDAPYAGQSVALICLIKLHGIPVNELTKWHSSSTRWNAVDKKKNKKWWWLIKIITRDSMEYLKERADLRKECHNIGE